MEVLRKLQFTPGPLFIDASATSGLVRNQSHGNLFIEKRQEWLPQTVKFFAVTLSFFILLK